MAIIQIVHSPYIYISVKDAEYNIDELTESLADSLNCASFDAMSLEGDTAFSIAIDENYSSLKKYDNRLNELQTLVYKTLREHAKGQTDDQK